MTKHTVLPRAFGESTIRRDMPAGLVDGTGRMDAAGRRRTLRAIGRASGASGFAAACERRSGSSRAAASPTTPPSTSSPGA